METLVPIKPAALTKLIKHKVTELLKLDKITPKDIEGLNNRERIYFDNACTKIMNKLSGDQQDSFLDKIDQILAPESKSDLWEHNQFTISEAIGDFIRDYNIMPTKSFIATQTGLSRLTVARHFAAYKKHPEFDGQSGQFKFLAPQLLAKVFKLALAGDMRAAKLYFDMIGEKKPDATLPNTQNNYIQINNTILSQENLARLTAEQLNQIEYIIKG